jgi:hypothetical protein
VEITHSRWASVHYFFLHFFVKRFSRGFISAFASTYLCGEGGGGRKEILKLNMSNLYTCYLCLICIEVNFNDSKYKVEPYRDKISV